MATAAVAQENNVGKICIYSCFNGKKGNIRRVIGYPNARFFSFSWVRSRLRGELARMDQAKEGRQGFLSVLNRYRAAGKSSGRCCLQSVF